MNSIIKDIRFAIRWLRKHPAFMVIAIVTRRIVVKDGHGDEFIKTQTLNSVTYTKNGGAITESDWQQETQNAKLKKNY